MDDLISRRALCEYALNQKDKSVNPNDIMRFPSAQPELEAVSKWKKEFREYVDSLDITRDDWKGIIEYIDEMPPAQPKRGKWILDRSGQYCCNRCMEPCATYVMMKPRDRFCKMCGAKMEGERKE